MKINVQQNISLAEHTTLKVGGFADNFVEVKNVAELVEALRFAQQTAVPPLVFGGGSDLLVSDAGYNGLVIKNCITGREYLTQGDNVLLTCGAGEVLGEVVKDSTAQGFWGLENLSLIPGTIGATPVQNVGAYGVEVSALIVEVVAIHSETLVEKIFTNAECQFGYRDSFFKTTEGKKWVVAQVVFKLSKIAAPKLEYGSLQNLKNNPDLTPEDVSKEVAKIRSAKFPDLKQVGTAGSFFKNPIISNDEYEKLLIQYPELPAFATKDNQQKVLLGWILDNVCGLRGYCQNGVCLYEQQALVLINVSATSASEIDSFANHIAEVVEAKTGIKIEREVRSV